MTDTTRLRKLIAEAKAEAIAQADFLRAGGQPVTVWRTRQEAMKATGTHNVYQCATGSWVEGGK